MRLHVILTSYNRPHLVRKALASLVAQFDANWRCIVQDDGSDADTQLALSEFAGDQRITIRQHRTAQKTRRETTRYAVLINEVLEDLAEETDALVAYLCDNAEYNQALVGTVRRWFRDHPTAFAGYVRHQRDVWQRDGLDGSRRLGQASAWGHWDLTPPQPDMVFGETANGFLDHSQVFHRLPCALRWDESPAALQSGDGRFFDRLIATYGPIAPISPMVLTYEHLLK